MPLSNRTCFEVNLRDALKCRVCKRLPLQRATYHRGFGYHHVQFQAHGGPDEAENLILLCEPCHTRFHQNKLQLPPLGDLTPLDEFACNSCLARLDPQSVDMNCGWYRCDQCRVKTHLFDHFGYQEPNAAADS